MSSQATTQARHLSDLTFEDGSSRRFSRMTRLGGIDTSIHGKEEDLIEQPFLAGIFWGMGFPLHMVAIDGLVL